MYTSKNVRSKEEVFNIKKILDKKLDLNEDCSIYLDNNIHIEYKDVEILSFGDNFVCESLLNNIIKVHNEEEVLNVVSDLLPLSVFLGENCIKEANACEGILSNLNYPMLLVGNTWSIEKNGTLIYVTIKPHSFNILLPGVGEESFDSIDEIIKVINNYDVE